MKNKKHQKEMSSALIESFECCICDDEKNGMFIVTSCRHMFHHSCLTTWFEEKTTCPRCRHDLRDDHSNLKIYTSRNDQSQEIYTSRNDLIEAHRRTDEAFERLRVTCISFYDMMRS